MVRLGTVAAAVGALAGLWGVATYLMSCHSLCLMLTDAPQGLEGTLFAALGVLLALDSLASLVAPKAVLYVGALLAALMVVLEAVNYSGIVPTTFYVTMALLSLSLVLSLASALRKTSVSEESHPLNLPVFG